METLCLTSSKYFLTFVDHYSKYYYVYFLKQKSEVLHATHGKDCVHPLSRATRQVVVILSDLGSIHNFLNAKFMQKFEVPTQPSDYVYHVNLVVAGHRQVWDRRVFQLLITIQDYTECLNFFL